MRPTDREERPLPAHPYRDSAIVYGVMAVILVVLAGVTGGSIVKATVAAVVFWVLACGWSSWKFRGRIRERDLAAAAAAAAAAEPEPVATAANAGPTAGSTNGAANGNGNGRRTGSGGSGA